MIRSLLKREAAEHIVAALEGWSQSFAADFLGTGRPRVCDLRAGRLERFSLEKLIRMLYAINHTVALKITCPTRRNVSQCAGKGTAEDRTTGRRSGE